MQAGWTELSGCRTDGRTAAGLFEGQTGFCQDVRKGRGRSDRPDSATHCLAPPVHLAETLMSCLSGLYLTGTEGQVAGEEGEAVTRQGLPSSRSFCDRNCSEDHSYIVDFDHSEGGRLRTPHPPGSCPRPLTLGDRQAQAGR